MRADANKSGGAEALKQASKTGQISLSEAQKILGVEAGSTWEQIEKVCMVAPNHNGLRYLIE